VFASSCDDQQTPISDIDNNKQALPVCCDEDDVTRVRVLPDGAKDSVAKRQRVEREYPDDSHLSLITNEQPTATSSGGSDEQSGDEQSTNDSQSSNGLGEAELELSRIVRQEILEVLRRYEPRF
jgi:hypothetical protein